MPTATEPQIPLVRRWPTYIPPPSGRICTALDSDLATPLCGGVIGEDGPQGIVCGPEGPGRRHHAVQEALLALHARGILLAICSKNDEAEALEVLEAHVGLLLRPAHFAAWRINWRDKPSNLREIAAELNIGIDAIAYLDDDPVELERVRSELPEVSVIELPPESDRQAESLRDHPVFARLTLSPEDEARQRYYAEQRLRLDAREKAPSLEAFFHSLAQEVGIERMTRETAERAAQLTQKTNQFNLTTRRYNAAQLLKLAEGGESQVFTVRVKDCYGDNGLTGVAIVRDTSAACEIDTFLLSCRVLGRGVEVAMLAFVFDRARGLGMREVRGRFVPTRKNAPAADFLPSHGLERQEGTDGAWVADPSRTRIQGPAWIRLTVAEGALA
jgi:FkbH-like protein